MNSWKKRLLSMLAALMIALAIWQPAATVTVQAASSEVSAQSLIEEALLNAAKGTPAAFAKWGTKKLIAAALNSDEESDCDKIMERLDEVAKNQQKIMDMISEIDTKIMKKDLYDKLNSFMKTTWSGTFEKNYKGLDIVNNGTYASEEDLAEAQKDYLVTDVADMNPDNLSGGDRQFDLDVATYGSYITEGEHVLYSDEKESLFSIWHQAMKYKYNWEHQSYEEWAAFQNNVTETYLGAAAIDKLSILARIDYINEYNADTSHTKKISTAGLEARLQMLDDQITKVKAIYDQYKVIPLADNIRCYQVPGHEMYLYATAKEPKIPNEANKKKGIRDLTTWCYNHRNGPAFTGLTGITGKWNDKQHGVDVTPNLNHWRSFISYDSNTLTPTAEWMQQIYKDYDGKATLYQIFFDKDKGNMTPPSGWQKNWNFIVDPNSSHPMEYWFGGTFKADRVYAPTVDGSAGLQKSIVYYYHNWSNNPPDTVRHYISIGITKNPQDNGDNALNPDFDAIWDNSSMGDNPENSVSGSYISADEPLKDETAGDADKTGAIDKQTVSKTAKTGDAFPVAPLIALAILTALAATAVILKRNSPIGK